MRKLSHDYFSLPDLSGKETLYIYVVYIVIFFPRENNVFSVFFPLIFTRENNVFFLSFPYGK